MTIQESGTAAAGGLIIGANKEFVVAGNLQPITISAVIKNNAAGASSLTDTSSGTLTFSSINTYTGGTTVDAGTLTLGPSGQTGIIRGNLTINIGATVNADALHWALGYNSGPANVVAVQTMTINGGNRLNFTDPGDGGVAASSITMTGGTISATGGGLFDWYGTNGTTQGFTNTPTLTIGASSATSTISGSMIIRFGANSITFNVAKGATTSGVDLLVSGPIIPSGDDTSDASSGITKTGLGTAVFSAANNYTGPTLISAGTLNLTGSLTGSSVTVNGSGAIFNESSTAHITGAGCTFTLTSGSASLAGPNTYTGATTVNGGTFSLSGSLTGSSITVG